jgi:hypothetical protein
MIWHKRLGSDRNGDNLNLCGRQGAGSGHDDGVTCTYCLNKIIKGATMSDRKVYVNVTARLIIRADEGVDIEEVLSEMDYSFTSTTTGAEIEATEIEDTEVTDSK